MITLKRNAVGWMISAVLASTAVQAQTGAPEKEELKLGFIKLTDMAPLAVAYEKHRHLHKLAQTLYTLTKISTGYLGQPL